MEILRGSEAVLEASPMVQQVSRFNLALEAAAATISNTCDLSKSSHHTFGWRLSKSDLVYPLTSTQPSHN